MYYLLCISLCREKWNRNMDVLLATRKSHVYVLAGKNEIEILISGAFCMLARPGQKSHGRIRWKGSETGFELTPIDLKPSALRTARSTYREFKSALAGTKSYLLAHISRTCCSSQPVIAVLLLGHYNLNRLLQIMEFNKSRTKWLWWFFRRT